MSLCLCLIRSATPQERSNLAINILNKTFNSAALLSSFPPHDNNNDNNNADNNKRIMIATKISQCVLSACLSSTYIFSSLSPQSDSNNNNNSISSSSSSSSSSMGKLRILVPLLIRIQTVHTENVPDKGTTVWYLQQKSIQVDDVLQNYCESRNILDFHVHANTTDNIEDERTTRTVQMIEALEGKLVGVHRDGKEEPFYTISLSTPINGTAGNTVREVQTNGFRYFLFFQKKIVSDGILHLITLLSLDLSIYLSISLTLPLFISLSLSLPLFISIHNYFLPIHVSFCPSLYLPLVCPSFHFPFLCFSLSFLLYFHLSYHTILLTSFLPTLLPFLLTSLSSFLPSYPPPFLSSFLSFIFCFLPFFLFSLTSFLLSLSPSFLSSILP